MTSSYSPPTAAAGATNTGVSAGDPHRAEPGGRRRFGSELTRAGFGLVGIALALAIWEVLAYLKNDPVILPTVQSTASTFWHYLGQRYPAMTGETLWQHALVSLARIGVGWGVGVVLGVVIGGVMASVRVVRYICDPLIELSRPLPPLAFIPLFIVWFGIGELPKFVLILVGVVPIMIIATVTALDAVPTELVQASRSLGASPTWSLVTVRLRSALPGIVTGARLAMGGAWTSIVAVELIASTSGLGYLINNAGVNLQTSLVLSGIVAISLLGIVLDSLLRLVHRLLDPTHR